jgi:hypothetical protein
MQLEELLPVGAVEEIVRWFAKKCSSVGGICMHLLLML